MKILKFRIIVNTFFLVLFSQVLGEPSNEVKKEGKISPVVADTVFSFNRGYYDAPLNLIISCATPESFILYTVDGTRPSHNNGEVGEKDKPVILQITETKIVRAIAVRDGFIPSNIETHTYFFREDILTQGRPDGAPNKVDFGMDPEIVEQVDLSDQLRKSFLIAVSYTHLTLPTICSV